MEDDVRQVSVAGRAADVAEVGARCAAATKVALEPWHQAVLIGKKHDEEAVASLGGFMRKN